MNTRCEEIRELAPELALGIVEGEERGRASSISPTARSAVAEWTSSPRWRTSCSWLAPHREPPLGFESQVLGEVLPAPPKRRRRRRFARCSARIPRSR